MANPWDSDPIVTPAAASPWASDPIVKPAAPTGAAPPEGGLGRRLGLGVRDVIEGIAGPAYDLAGMPLRAAGLPVHTMSENLTSLGLPQAQTPGEHMVSSIAQPVAGVLTGQGVGRAMMGAASPVAQAVGGALSAAPATQAVAAGVGGATQEATGSPMAGLAAGVAVPLLAGGVGGAARALTGGAGGASVPDAALGQLAKQKYNIPIQAPDLTNNSLYRIGADQMGKLPFSGAAPAAAAKQQAWQGAIAREMGEPSVSAFTPDVMNQARLRIGRTFDGVAARTSIPPPETATLVSDLHGVLPQAAQVLTAAELGPLKLQIKNISDMITKGNGTIGGDAYQALTRAKAPLDLAESSTNPNVAHFAGKIRDALDDAFVRSAAPEDQQALTQARYQYRVMRTIDPLVAGSRDGNITPDAFMQKVLTASRRFDSPTGGMAYTGGGNIGELARIGKLMRAPPQTGSADRAAINFAAGGLAGGSVFTANPLMMAALPATLAANRAGGAYLRSNFLANRVIESSLAGPQAGQNPLLTAGVVGAQNRLRLRQD